MTSFSPCGRQLRAKLRPVLAAMRFAVDEVRDDADVADLPELAMRGRLEAFGHGRHAVRLLNGEPDDFRIRAVGAEQRDVRAVQRGDDLRAPTRRSSRCQNLAGQIRRRRVRHGVVRVDDVEPLVARHLDDLVRQRQQVLRLAEHADTSALRRGETTGPAGSRRAGTACSCSARARGGRGTRASCPARSRRCRCLQSRRSRRCRCSRCFQQGWTQDRVRARRRPRPT